jgi:threonine dehydrogenase-like Zn-dependent dehydrogenase
MRGVFCDGAGIALRDDLPEPIAGPEETVLRVRSVGICNTDLQLARGYMKFHGILGHEFVGDLADGCRVAAEINAACHRCPTCRAGRRRHCPNRTVVGILNHDGAMAERVRVPSVNLHQVPDSISDREAVFIEPLAAALHVAEQVPLGPGVRTAIVGDGKLGLLCAWAARLAGAEVSLVGKHSEKLALAGKDITTHTLDEAAHLGRDFDVVADCTGSPSGLSTALGLVRPCGTVVLKTTIAGTHDVSLAPIVIDEIQLIGSRCGPFPPAIDALARRAIDVRPLIGAEFTLDEAETAFQAAAAPGAKKILIRVHTG